MTTAADILEVLASLGHKSDPEARTAAELAEAWGKDPRWVRVAIKTLLGQGHVRVTHKITTAISGRTTTVPAYVISIPKETRSPVGAFSGIVRPRVVPIQGQKGSSNGTGTSGRQRRSGNHRGQRR